MTNEVRNYEKLNAEGTQEYAHLVTSEHTLVTEYTQVNENFRMLADIRFKLLALIPTLGGVAIFLLSKMEQGAPEPQLGYSLLFLISGLGFVATLGVTFYDQRNSALYNALIARARYLETELELPVRPKERERLGLVGGQFKERPARDRYLFRYIELGHDSGLALIYGAVLGAWFYPLTSTFLGLARIPPEVRHGVSLILAAIMVVLFIRELLRLDGTSSIRELLGANAKVNVRFLKNGHDIWEERLRFSGKEIGWYKEEEDNSAFTLYECPGGRYRVYVKRGRDICYLQPWHLNSNGSVEYPTYEGEGQLLKEFPEFGEAVHKKAVRNSPVRDLG